MTANATNTSNPITVSQGGTGDSSFTAYVPICAGTTSTGQLQSIASIGTSGQILTSNDASNLPTFQTNSGTFAPNSTIITFDDFISTVLNNSTFVSTYNWTGAGLYQIATTDNGHPGNIGNKSTTSGTPYMILSNSGIILGGGSLTLNFVFKIVTLSNSTNRYTLTMGIGDTGSINQQNGCYVYYSDNNNSGNWSYVTASSSTRTTSNSSTSVTTGWHNAQITINAAASSVSFSMDGSSLGTAIATNIPTTEIFPFFLFGWSVGTIAANTLILDLMYLTQNLTSAR